MSELGGEGGAQEIGKLACGGLSCREERQPGQRQGEQEALPIRQPVWAEKGIWESQGRKEV